MRELEIVCSDEEYYCVRDGNGLGYVNKAVVELHPEIYGLIRDYCGYPQKLVIR